ncbi:hypothetical protein [Pseudobdellovibrio exovorus]|nr:hypothetical protein [Pseudobdellovibrio exovorus]
MKKLDSFLIAIAVIMTLLGGVYYYAANSMSYFDDPVIQSMLERQIQLRQLEKKLHVIDVKTAKSKAVSRAIASIPQNSAVGDVVLDSSATPEKMAKKFYEEAKMKCYQEGQEKACIQTIDKVVSHFPESIWAGESLVLLTDYYYRTARLKQAREVVQILKDEFSHSTDIQSKVAIIERVIR